MLIKVIQDIIDTLEIEWGIVQIIEVDMVTIKEVIKGRGQITIEEVILGIEVMIGIGVDHMKDRIKIGEIIEV